MSRHGVGAVGVVGFAAGLGIGARFGIQFVESPAIRGTVSTGSRHQNLQIERAPSFRDNEILLASALAFRWFRQL